MRRSRPSFSSTCVVLLAAVAPCDSGGADVGSWSELWRLGGKDGDHNLIRGDAVALDTQGSLIWSDDGMEVGVAGLRDLIVVATPSAVIVLPKDRAQFHWAKSGEYVTQVTAIGPISLDYVHPEDDPRNK